MQFHDPVFLLLILVLPWLWIRRHRLVHSTAFGVADGAQVESFPDTWRTRCARSLPWLRMLSVALAIVALARPQLVEREIKTRSEGLDLIVAMDLSTSMLAEPRDIAQPSKNRLTVAKEVLGEFLQRRSNDRVGLLAFAARPYAASPLTNDHHWLREIVANLQVGLVEDGTAIGDAILAALNRLRERPAASQAIILVTDGRNNAGEVEPLSAAAAAKALGIRIYTIGIGSRGPVVMPMESPLGGTLFRDVQADLDEATLSEIASNTGGRYFRADDQENLASVFDAIDTLEKRQVEEVLYFSYGELYHFVLLSALFVAILELMLRHTSLRQLP
jgi:Ca-activated chloride channel homolog